MTNKVYVINEDKFVYEVGVKNHGDFEKLITLNLVYGWEYISEESDQQGFVSPDYFVEEVQYNDFAYYPLHESILERLKEEGFKMVKLTDLGLENLLHSI